MVKGGQVGVDVGRFRAIGGRLVLDRDRFAHGSWVGTILSHGFVR